MRISIFSIVLGGLFLINSIQAKDCTGPLKVHKETKTCIFDIEYPKVSNTGKECEIRNWIDQEMTQLDDGNVDLDPEMHRKNEFWVTSDIYDSGGWESVKIEEYVYAQGANGSTDVKTFTWNSKTGKALDLFDIIDSKKKWHLVLNPFFEKLNDTDNPSHTVFMNSLDGGPDTDPSVFQSFVLDGKNLILFFDQESVAPHSSGVISVSIPLTAIKDVMKDSFKREVHL